MIIFILEREFRVLVPGDLGILIRDFPFILRKENRGIKLVAREAQVMKLHIPE